MNFSGQAVFRVNSGTYYCFFHVSAIFYFDCLQIHFCMRIRIKQISGVAETDLFVKRLYEINNFHVIIFVSVVWWGSVSRHQCCSGVRVECEWESQSSAVLHRVFRTGTCSPLGQGDHLHRCKCVLMIMIIMHEELCWDVPADTDSMLYQLLAYLQHVFIVWHIFICKCHVVYMLERKVVYMQCSNYRNNEILTFWLSIS